MLEEHIAVEILKLILSVFQYVVLKILGMQKFVSMYECLLVFHGKTTERI